MPEQQLNWFQTYLKESWNTDANTSATIFITIVIFGLGYFLTGIVASVSNYIERRRIRKIVGYNIESLIKSLKKQASFYSKYHNSLDYGNKGGFAYTSVVIPAITALENVGYQTIYDAYFTGIENLFCDSKKLKSFLLLWRCIVAIPRWQESSQLKVAEHLDVYNSHNQVRNESLGEVQKITDHFITDIKNRTVDKALAQYAYALDKILTEHQSRENAILPDITEFVKVQPLLELNRSQPIVPFVHDLNHHLLTASLAFTNMNNRLNAERQMAIDWYHTFRGHAKMLKIVLIALS